MNRRALLAGVSTIPALVASRVLAQPMPILGPVGGRTVGGGPLFSLNPGPPGKTLDLSFMTPGTLDPRITFTRASTATYFNSAGVMQTAATNAPRWDYNPSTLVLNGLLIEEARTNLSFNSGNLVLGLAPIVGTIVVGPDRSPDGVLFMSRMVEAAVTNVQYAQASATTVVGTMYTISLYAKAGQVRYLQIVFDDGTNGGFATFDLQAGVISQALAARGSGVIGTASVVGVGNGIFRCVISAQAAATTSRIAIVLCDNFPTPGYAPFYAGSTANGLSVWGLQCEAGAFPTSYIPTTAAAVTRAQDVCGISAANMTPWFVSPYGSWMAEFITLDPSTNNNRIIGQPTAGGVGPLYYDAAMHLGQWDNVGVVFTANNATLGAVTKGATTHDATTGRNCLNAGAIASGALSGGYSALLAGVNFLITDAPGSPQNMTGYIRRVSYWPRILTNAEMQSVTT